MLETNRGDGVFLVERGNSDKFLLLDWSKVLFGLCRDNYAQFH